MIEEADEIDAASRDGITIGLVDSIITLANVLSLRLKAEARRLKRDPDEWAWHSQSVQDALCDLAGNETVRQLLFPRDDRAMDIISRAAALLKPKVDDALKGG
jgi:hypothetical protein